MFCVPLPYASNRSRLYVISLPGEPETRDTKLLIIVDISGHSSVWKTNHEVTKCNWYATARKIIWFETADLGANQSFPSGLLSGVLCSGGRSQLVEGKLTLLNSAVLKPHCFATPCWDLYGGRPALGTDFLPACIQAQRSADRASAEQSLKCGKRAARTSVPSGARKGALF
jgi:hypothetical protein